MVTLDRVRRSAKETVIEKAGTTLENKTIPGDLVIAESVGEGNVTLKNVTVLGSVIVKGGGANSIYFDGVRVGGTVRLQKVNVHLRLIGNTALDRVEIGLPCRITQDSPFEGALGALVSGVTVSGSLTVKKTETEGGAKAPTISGGSSSGGGVTLKEIESIAPITAEVPYGTSALDALVALPAEITLNVKDGSEVKTTAAGWSWADGVCGSSQLRLHLRRRRFHFLLPQRKGRQEA